MRTSVVGTMLATIALLWPATSEAQIRTKCEVVGLSPKDGRVDIAVAHHTFDPKTLRPDPKRTADSCVPQWQNSPEYGDRKSGHIVVSMAKCRDDEPYFKAELFLPGSRFSIALRFSNQEPSTGISLEFKPTDPFKMADGRESALVGFECSIVR